MPPDHVRILHMVDAIRDALEFVEHRTREDLDRDRMLVYALTRVVEIVGEAAKNVSRFTRLRAPNLPWREMAGTRDRLAHGYFDVNLDIIWDIATLEFPSVLAELETLLDLPDGARPE